MQALQNERMANVLDVTIWECDQRAGIVTLDQDGKLVMYATDPSRQDEFEEFMMVEFACQKKKANKVGDPYTEAQFLTELPAVLRGYYSAERIYQPQIAIPERLPFKPFDRNLIPSKPRPRRVSRIQA
jgi:hypothetical protein